MCPAWIDCKTLAVFAFSSFLAFCIIIIKCSHRIRLGYHHLKYGNKQDPPILFPSFWLLGGMIVCLLYKWKICYGLKIRTPNCLSKFAFSYSGWRTACCCLGLIEISWLITLAKNRPSHAHRMKSVNTVIHNVGDVIDLTANGFEMMYCSVNLRQMPVALAKMFCFIHANFIYHCL